MDDIIIGRDLYLEYKFKKGAPQVRQHRVWDRDRFIEARTAEGKAGKKPEEKFTVKVTDKAAYVAARAA